MPYDPEELKEGGWGADDTFVGVSRESLDDAIRKAVHAAGQRHGTWLQVTSIQLLSVDDPNVGGYRVSVARGAGG